MKDFYKQFLKIFKLWTPDNSIKVCWDMIGVLFILIQLLQIPLYLSFTAIPYDDGEVK